ncbi:MAG: ABC transporter ATP-binding protein [Bradyrhizobium sp.]|uniref:ABC transporter ATP-binding protein n=1 Tax=Bradyrhizobium sp. TaxID=376 RepID=UPI001C286248|nr:ABC transporter ATP-binding protein [Bradyrhizobium sp.]MBU6462314.1 ABC transporter ATP-binding protein [Pseudomonadota bacterium]MDE2067366.1 ABC transporter ATP-binding protein [Bradyrhizobium sp.]MDE2242748.1 ABC transporter ATP-binding protein [Bradyrhizobium sp.]MDE2468628.1 ABC transporter ATP-binding protein [Bradyrhizobium sp.]
MTESAVSFSGLSYAYHPGKWLFRNYSASVAKGNILAVLGPNGRGKTTLLKLLLGALKPTTGCLSINGSVAFVPQLFHVSFDYSVLDMVLMGRARKIGLFSQPTRSDEEAAIVALDRFGMAEFAGRPFHELSGGERQLVIFARTLMSEADVLILDEPTSALDLKNQSIVLDWIARLSRADGLTIILTTHHPHHALAVADEVLLMMGGSQYSCGNAAHVLTEVNLAALYGVPLRRVLFEHDGRRIETLAPVLPMIDREDTGRPTAGQIL